MKRATSIGLLPEYAPSERVATHGQAGVVDEDSKPHILAIAIGSSDQTTLVAGVQAAELENVLVNPGSLTVFAPNSGFLNRARRAGRQWRVNNGACLKEAG